VIAKILSIDLSKVQGILNGQYSRKGKRAWDPASMFRSLLVIALEREPSITKWVIRMRVTPLFAILSGFNPDRVPWVRGTHEVDRFYDFIKRLIPKGMNISSKEKTCESLCQNQTRGEDAPKTPRDLSISGDSTMIKFYGTKVCDCKEKGIYRCKCPRRYSEGEARWGWDSYREEWVFGRSLYEIIEVHSPYGLPIFLKMAQAQRHDSILGIATLHEAKRLYEDHSFWEFITDSAHDAYPIYQLLEHCPQTLNKATDCQYFNCSTSSYGRVIYTKSRWDLRLFTRVPRGSKLWKKRYARHSASPEI
jgi:hypothetical protein